MSPRKQLRVGDIVKLGPQVRCPTVYPYRAGHDASEVLVLNRPVRALRVWCYEIKQIAGNMALLVAGVLPDVDGANVLGGWFDLGNVELIA